MVNKVVASDVKPFLHMYTLIRNHPSRRYQKDAECLLASTHLIPSIVVEHIRPGCKRLILATKRAIRKHSRYEQVNGQACG